MKDRINLYIRQLQTSYNGQPWLGASIASKLQGVTAEEAYARPVRGSRSIIEFVHHINCWREVLILRLEGDLDTRVKIDSARDWKTYNEVDHKTWNAVLHKLEKSQNRILDILATKNDDLLDNKKFDYETLIEGVIQHDIYHLGQIALVKSQLAKVHQPQEMTV